MKKSILALAVIAAMGVNVAQAAEGGSSGSGVQVGTSNHFLFDTGNSGLRLNNDIYGYIDIADGPIRGSNAAIAEQGNGGFLQPKHVIGGIISWPNIAQVWRDTAAVNGPPNNQYANFAVNSIRQIVTFPPLIPAPQFGGLVIGQVGINSTGAPANPVVPLAVGSGVYFGEWAPSVGSPAASGTNLNMTSNDRTVWYVGDNAVTSMPTAINATYGVIGINQTGTDANGNTLPGGLPDNLNLYTGKLTVTYNGVPATSSITGSLTRAGSSPVNFTGSGTIIKTDGTFDNSAGANNIQGRFYNGAEALAGIHKGGAGVADDVAFGGSKVSGTITP